MSKDISNLIQVARLSNTVLGSNCRKVTEYVYQPSRSAEWSFRQYRLIANM